MDCKYMKWGLIASGEEDAEHELFCTKNGMICTGCKELEPKKVNICGIPHKVIECEDNFDIDAHFGQIDYKACEIRINKDMSQENKEETLCHEMVHGIFVHLGYHDYAQDEQLVQALGNAIYQGFDVKEVKENEINRRIDWHHESGLYF